MSVPQVSIDFDGTVHYAPNLPMFADAPLGAALGHALDLPVVVDNDANVAAWGEVCHGAARGHAPRLGDHARHRVGGGIIIDGRVLRGAHGFAAEVGHWQFDPHGPRVCVRRARALGGRGVGNRARPVGARAAVDAGARAERARREPVVIRSAVTGHARR